METIEAKMAQAIAATQALLDALKAGATDGRCVSLAATKFEEGFLWAASAVDGGSILNG